MKNNSKKRIMYNEDVKKQYIADAVSVSDAQNIELLERGIINCFIRSEKLEKQIKKDIYEMDKTEIKWFLSEFLCGGQLYQMATLSTIRAYVDWTIANSYSNKENSLSKIKITDIDVSDSYADVMVKDEADLIESLNTVLDCVDNAGVLKNIETVDNSRLCIFLLIFAGIPFKSLFFIKKEDVNLENRVILYGSQNIYISDFLHTVLERYFKMDELQKVGKGGVEYTKTIIDEGYLISNTKSFASNRDKMRLSYTSDISQIFKKCSKKLNPSSILDSGIFYRMFLKEKETGKLDCLEYLRARKHQSSVINYPDRVKKICQHEYETWKRAFNL